MHKLISTLNVFYYAFYVLAVGLVCLMIYLMRMGGLAMLEPQSPAGQAVQYLVIFYVIASVPGALYGFKRMIDTRVKPIEDSDEKLREYKHWSIIRIVLIGIGVLLGIAAFYLLKTYQSMLWCAGISLIALYFCKPSEGRVQQELDFQI